MKCLLAFGRTVLKLKTWHFRAFDVTLHSKFKIVLWIPLQIEMLEKSANLVSRLCSSIQKMENDQSLNESLKRWVPHTPWDYHSRQRIQALLLKTLAWFTGHLPSCDTDSGDPTGQPLSVSRTCSSSEPNMSSCVEYFVSLKTKCWKGTQKKYSWSITTTCTKVIFRVESAPLSSLMILTLME